MRLKLAFTLLALSLALSTSGCAGCRSEGSDDTGGDDDDDGTGCIGGPLSLSPATASVTLDGSAPAPITFTVTAVVDGATVDVDEAALAWTATRTDDTPAGAVAAGVFHPFSQAGGVVTVRATDTCEAATSEVTLFLEAVIGAPEDPAAWTAGVVDTSGTIATIVYPSDETRFPRNIHQTLFQWRTGGHTEFRLTFEGPSSTVTVFTDGAHPLCASAMPVAGCWEADTVGWNYLAASNAGETATWTLDALDTSTIPATIRRTPPITIGFSKRDVEGAIFYWSTTSEGIRRASIGAAAPEDYLSGSPSTVYPAPNADTVRCVGCHSVSRDGRYIAAPTDATSGKSLWILEVTQSSPPDPLIKAIPNTQGHGFATFSPDSAELALTWGGDLWTIDRATGAYGVAIDTTPFGAVTHPDWSPDGTRLAVSTGNGDAPADADIALIPRVAGAWGAPEVLVPADGATNLFPCFSPDGGHLAYSRGSGGHTDLSSQLYAVAAEIGATPIELVNANRVVSNQLGDGQHENSLPTWAPPGDFAWVAFNSGREYGVVKPQGTQQIWVAGIDPALLAAGIVDPSFPAFRLQFQGLDEDNHRAFWTLDITDDGGDPDD